MTAPSKPRLLVIGAGEFQLPLVQEAARSCEVLVAAPSIGSAFAACASEELIADVRDFEAIAAFAGAPGSGRRPVDGVITDGTDIAVLTVARVADLLGLPGIGEDAARLFTSKAAMRERLEELGLPALPYANVRDEAEALAFYREVGGTVIVKPSDTQGSRGVHVCAGEGELARWLPDALGHSAEGVAVVERFATGREFVVEGVACAGAFANLCIGDTRYFAGDSHAAKERVFPTCAPDELRDRVLELNARIVGGFGLRQGIAHSEFIMEGDEIYLIETAARGGGAFISSDLIPLSCGLQSERFLVGAALGQASSLSALPGVGDAPVTRDSLALNPRSHCAYLAFYLPAGEVVAVRGVEEVLGAPFVHRTQIADLPGILGCESDGKCSDKTTRRLVTVSAPDADTLAERMSWVRATLQVDVRAEDGSLAGLIWS